MTVVDASVLVSALQPADAHYDQSRQWLRQYLIAGGVLIAPVLVTIEVAGAIARRSSNPERGQLVIERLHAIPQLHFRPLDQQLAASAAHIAAALRLRGADAVYGALAAQLRMPLVTWDREQIERGGQRIVARAPSS